MEQSAPLNIENLKITQEQFILASQSLHLQRPGCEAVYPVGLYGWRKRCLYFFLLLLLVTMIVNLALTVWIIKVMNFSMEGMGNLQLNQDGLHLEGVSEFQQPLYVSEIRSRRDSLFVLRSERNVTLNARNHQGQLTGQLTVGPEGVEAQCQRLEVRSRDGGRLLFSADEEKVTMTTEKFTVTGSEGAVFGHSVETPLIQATTSEDLRLESPTRTLTMEAPRGVEVSSTKGTLKISSRKDLQLESTEGEILLDTNSIRLENLPLGIYSLSTAEAFRKQVVYEVCVCPSGKIYLSPAESVSTCQAMSSICLWS
ncbi:zeta-sarcoglycan-like [Girardinichthys multiradiatus]|uniref:zeta-sarcoglycan-like n=1 Tax=Girardinichthys multiradiatus TaxID=208333 RepID=UPI001FAD26A9|nr:zeta-sarcoglycan-like [Girardinichthys multiradiatus]XP_047242758.1 zeta-sarcoglycan-like [Girardinichthys multiradiatus]